MTDSSDEELRRLIRAGVDQSLKGWEFTPAMARQVLSRIAAEESGAGVTSAPQRWRRLVIRRRQWAVWGVVAAAAALGVCAGLSNLRPDLPGRLAGSTASTAGTLEPESSHLFDKADGDGAEVPADTGESAAMVASAQGTGAGEMPLAAATRLEMAAVADEADETAGREKDAGSGTGEEGWYGSGEGSAAAAVAETLDEPVLVHQGRVIRLPVLADVASGEAAAQLQGALLPAEGSVGQSLAAHRMHLADRGSRPDGGSLAITAVSDVAAGASRMAVSASGRTAVAQGNRLAVLGASGQPEQVITLPEKPAAVLWAGPDLLAVADSSQVTVFQNGIALWRIPFAAAGMAAPAESDLLVVWNETEAVALEPITGREIWLALPGRPRAAVIGCTVAPDGRYVAVTAATGDGFVLWILDGSGNPLLTERLAAEPQVDIQGDQAVVAQPDGVRIYSLTR